MYRLCLIMILLLAILTAASSHAEAVGPVEATLECKSLKPSDCNALSALLASRKAGFSAVLTALNSTKQSVRSQAADLAKYAEFGSDAVRTEMLIRSLSSTPEDIRGETIQALSNIGHPSAAAKLLSLVRTETNSRNLMFLSNALGKIQSKKSRSALVNLLQSKSPRIQQSAVRNLGAMDDSAVIGPIINRCMAEITAGFVRIEAARVLAVSKDERALAPLVILLANANIHVRKAAVRALATYGSRHVVPTLLAMFSDELLLTELAEALGRLGDPRATAKLVDVAINDSIAVTTRVKALWSLGSLSDPTATKAFVAALGSKNERVVYAAAQGAGRAKAKGACHALTNVLEFASPNTAKMALWALEAITNKKFGVDPNAWRRWLNSEG